MSIQKDTIYNLLGALIPLAVGLITIPIYLGLIGEARYGVLAIAWLLLGYFGLFDLGLGRATAQRIAKQAGADVAVRARTFWTALALNVGLGVVGGLLIYPVASYFFGSVLKIEDVLRPEIKEAVPWLALAVPVATLSGVLSGALQGRGRFLELNVISVLGSVIFQVGPLLVAMWQGSTLAILLPAAIFCRLITLLLLLLCCRRHVFSGQNLSFDREQASELLKFGGWVTVSSLVGPMMVILDRVIIGALSGAKAVGYYTVPFQLAERSTLISGALSSALFPRLASSSAKEGQVLAVKAIRILLAAVTPVIALAILLIEPFMSWWISPEFAAQSARAGQILFAGFWINSCAFILVTQLQARGRPDLVAKMHLLELLPYFGFLYIGLQYFGLIGAASVFSLRVIADFGLLSALAGIWKQNAMTIITPALLVIMALIISVSLVPGQLDWYVCSLPLLLSTLIWAFKMVYKSRLERPSVSA